MFTSAIKRRALHAGPALVFVLASARLAAQAPETRAPGGATDAERIRQLECELDAVKRRLDTVERPPAGDGSSVELTPVGTRQPLDRPAALRGVYDKPFLASLWHRAYIGGYTELEFHDFHDGVLGIPGGFRAHRTNLFLYSDVSDRVHFGSEFEFENEEPGEDIEVKVEMAFVDWTPYEEIALRAGVLLVPLGRVNVNHDGPTRELTERPLVSTFVIPTTLSEAGAGLHGTLQPGGSIAIAYEAYVTNGFRLLDENGKMASPFVEREQILREGRPSLGGDENNDVATTGRVSLQLPGTLDIGGSWHVGTYDDRGDNTLNLLAADAAFVEGPFVLEGEYAWAGFERDTFARTAGIPDVFWGCYLQASFRFMPESWRESVSPLFGDPQSSFTLVLRYDWIDLDGDTAGAVEPGFCFRPVADTVLKFSYRISTEDLGVRNVPGREKFNDEGFVFSLATYF